MYMGEASLQVASHPLLQGFPPPEEGFPQPVGAFLFPLQGTLLPGDLQQALIANMELIAMIGSQQLALGSAEGMLL